MLNRQLPMAGHTRGNRSPVTCELKCGSACSHPVPNTSDNPHFRDIANAAISRRAALGLGGGLAATVVIGANTVATPPAAAANPANASGGGGKLSFRAIDAVPRTVDDMTVPEGYDWQPIIRWGDPLFDRSPEFDIANQTGEGQAAQFGYNCDYLNVISDGGSDYQGYLVSNHEYTNENIMFSPQYIRSNFEDVVNAGIAAHGMSVVELRREGRGRPWEYIRGGRRNRRITGFTTFNIDGPATGSELLKTADDASGSRVEGTLNNCAGGTTPWGTVLSGEENFDQYFVGTGAEEEARLGISPGPTQRQWERVHNRFNLNNEGYANEANRFGWIVEVDPEDPSSTPVKHTALGRFKHEAGTAQISQSGHAVVYMGDDQVNDYVYKFVSKKKYRKGDRRHNVTLLSEGTLYVAAFEGDSPETEIDGSGTVPSDGEFDGRGRWVPLVRGHKSLVPGMTIDEVLVHTRLAADTMGATKMDRPEDFEPNPVTGKIYLALTNNSERTPQTADEANPVAYIDGGNRDGHVIEITERRGDHTSEHFGWNILLLAGDPEASETAYFSGFPKEKVSPISCPDNVAFDSEGNLWISTDGQPGKIGYADALHKVTLEGRHRGRVEQFLAVPADAETCGPVIHDRDNSVFVNVQHPGEGGEWGAHTSYFPDFLPQEGQLQVGDAVATPRPTVVQVFAAQQYRDDDSDQDSKDRGKGKGHGRWDEDWRDRRRKHRDDRGHGEGKWDEGRKDRDKWNDGRSFGHRYGRDR